MSVTAFRISAAAFLLAQGLAGAGALSAGTSVPADVSTGPIVDHGSWVRKSYVIPALEILGSLTALNLYDRNKYGTELYGTDWKTFSDNVSEQKWAYDKDSFRMNQIGHPYQGSMMFGFARSSGLSFWESLIYSDAGSLLWEVGGETDRPSVNDLITTAQAGSILGEPLFRMANMVLESGEGAPGFWREAGAAALFPPLALNRFVFGERFRKPYPRRDPAVFSSIQLGASARNYESSGGGLAKRLNRKQVGGDFTLSYGLPGKDGYKYSRPFDYFNFDFTLLSGAEALETIFVRGLLVGDSYERGENFRGIWGLYGSYDYISPTVFRMGNTSASLGTTWQWWLSRRIAMQGTLLAGPGFGGGGSRPVDGRRNYHMGPTAEGLAALRLIFGSRLMLDLNGRTYYVSGIGPSNAGDSEGVDRFDASLTARVAGPHGVGVKYVGTGRDSGFAYPGDRFQSEHVTSIFYTYLFDTHFGAVEWREGAGR